MDGNSQFQGIDKEYPRFQYPGLMSVGTCFLRARVRHDSLVIVCAQLYDYHGTSVTNAIEEVREAAIVQLHDDVGLQHLMPARKWWQRKPVREEVLANAAALSTIIEHWPKGRGLAPAGSFAIVEFDDAGKPEWDYRPQAMAARACAVEEEFLTVDPERLYFRQC
ncbi:hypothetical protein IPU70_28090 [Achromobacter sp. SD115]|jgi:hypothetical protein|uniref:Uncharacterized protein n=2 Tax=Achromobacter TaxID=222 RepID=A0A0D6ISK9_ALCXX|nr:MULTISPECIES: hypothetical protein [Achromobacter]MBQ2647316.1 hypothetical protein [Achromobacter sp.]AZS82010.1 hypothetical protein ELS24_28420 [Achromobacter spanius]EJO27684.1 hypothetical protein QWC_30581 [Achromobacter marplatensis]MBC9904567.1 hypothetical protein [Achromobacter xylosoxidans]MBD0868109.1 hypothetical protein [Achromobacter xylosoxidans]